MEITFNGTLQQIIKEMEEFITNYSKNSNNNDIIEFTGERDDVVIVKDLRQACVNNNKDYSSFKRKHNLQPTIIKRNNIRYRGFRGIKLVDNQLQQ